MYDPEAMGSNPSQAELGAHNPPESKEPKLNIHAWVSLWVKVKIYKINKLIPLPSLSKVARV